MVLRGAVDKLKSRGPGFFWKSVIIQSERWVFGNALPKANAHDHLKQRENIVALALTLLKMG